MIWLALAWRVTFCSARSPERRSGNGSSNDSVARVPPCMTPPGGTDTESSPRNCKCSSTRRGRGRAPTRWSGCVEAGARSGDVQRSVILAGCDRRRRAPSGCGEGRATLKPGTPSSATILLPTPRRYEEWRSPEPYTELPHCHAPPGHGTTRVCGARIRPVGTVCQCSVPELIYS